MADTPRRINWLAVVAGYFTDLTLSLIIAYIGSQLGANLERGITFNTSADTLTAILLVVSTGLGGWLAARLAKHEQVLHGVLVGGIGIMDMLIMSFFGERSPLATILLQVVAVGVGGLGGWLSRWVPAPQRQ
jgi:putative membrane protein (TIGR04086 family)